MPQSPVPLPAFPRGRRGAHSTGSGPPPPPNPTAMGAARGTLAEPGSAHPKGPGRGPAHPLRSQKGHLCMQGVVWPGGFHGEAVFTVAAAEWLGAGASLGPAGVAGALGPGGVKFHPHNQKLLTEDSDLGNGRNSLCAQLRRAGASIPRPGGLAMGVRLEATALACG